MRVNPASSSRQHPKDQARPPVVLQVLPALETGGVERGTVEIADAIVQAGGVALVASSGGRMAAAVERVGGEHICLQLASKNPAVIWRNAGRLAALIRERGIDIERVIAISRHIAAHLIGTHGTDPAKVRIIPRGVDPDIFDPTAVSGSRVVRLVKQWRLLDSMRIVMLPGRLTRWKGQEVLIDALAKLHRPDVCCVFVGSDQGRHNYALSLVRRAEALGISGQVRLVGDCDDMPAALLLADVVVNASIEPEGFGRTVIEAQAMARPVIATAHGGAAETVSDGDTGWLVTPGDADSLAAVLAEALDMPDQERQALGERAREAVRRGYTTLAMQHATLAVYDELLAPAS
jgi:glycosyltransferase involved in cell wall biosynthesis